MLLVYTAGIEEVPEQTRFEEIYYNYRKQMLLVAMRILHNKDDAEDAVQNALLGIAKHIKTVPTDTQRERAYILTAAQNAALSMLPQREKWDTMADISRLELAALEDVFETVASCQDYALLLRAIGQLKSPYLEVLTLIYVQELDTKKAADILCRKEETVRKQLNRGKKQLIALCRKEGMCLG